MNAFIADYWQGCPAFAPFAPLAAELAWREWPAAEAFYAALNGLGAPVHFTPDVPQLPYEQHVGATGCVPTRHASWHDLFNALVWCRFPLAKRAINALHRQHWYDADGVSPAGRTPVRDGLTLLDESGALLLSDEPSLLQDVRDMNWPAFFVANRARLERHVRVLVFGHGLLEKCLHPYIGMTAKALLMEVDSGVLHMSEADRCAWADSALAERLAADALLSADLHPLPMLGLPGWWPGNEAPAFYDNTKYFRRGRSRA